MNVTEPILKELTFAGHIFFLAKKFLHKHHKKPTKYLDPDTRSLEDTARAESLPTEEERTINYKYQL